MARDALARSITEGEEALGTPTKGSDLRLVETIPVSAPAQDRLEELREAVRAYVEILVVEKDAKGNVPNKRTRRAASRFVRGRLAEEGYGLQDVGVRPKNLRTLVNDPKLTN